VRYKAGKCRLRYLLAERRISQDDLAHIIGMKRPQLNRYVNDDSKMTLPTAKTIAETLGVSIDDLYEWEIRRD
jgi:transcriptional regulator with XRE-family HTH domain